MARAISYLESLTSSLPSSTAPIIFLQECVEDDKPEDPNTSRDISQLKSSPWIQSRFHITDLRGASSPFWSPGGGGGAHYGQVTLIDRRLHVEGVGRLRLVSEFGRSALFVDVKLRKGDGKGGGREDGVLRMANVHFDSHAGPCRSAQWAGLAAHLIPPSSSITPLTFSSSQSTSPRPRIYASVIAGDTNATRPRDLSAPQLHGFTDAYLALGGIEGSEEGATCGFQSSEAVMKRWGKRRLDKVCFWGGRESEGGGRKGGAEVLRIKTIERIGVGLSVTVLNNGDDESEEDEEGDKGAEPKVRPNTKEVWVTDHYGLMACFEIGRGLGV